MSDTERESMEFDVVIVGAGPAGLAAAIRLKQVDPELSVVVLEKGAEVGAHILSGAVVDPIGVDRLLPGWREEADHPFKTPVEADHFLILGPAGSIRLPNFLMPPLMNNHGNYIVSLGNVCRWLAGHAEALGVEIYPGFAATEVLYNDEGAVIGVATGDMGIERDGSRGPNYAPGMALLGKYVLIGEGVRGSLAKVLIEKFNLSEGREPQKFGIGLKELWQVRPENHRPGLVQHSFGWPLGSATGGGSFLYHLEDNQVAVGFVVHLNYKNPYLAPFEEFQRFKTHPTIAGTFDGAKRISYGARAITEGGFQSVPKLTFPGGALIGCSAGLVNVPRIKGSHNAVLSGMMAAEHVAEAVAAGLPEVARHLGSVEGGEGAPDRPFAALNDALAADGYVLLAGPGAEAEEVVRIVVLTVPEDGAVAAWPRGLIVADSGARLTVEEIHAGAAGTYLSAPATEVVVGDGARVDHFLHQDQGPEAFHMASLTAAIGRDAVFDSFAFSTGAALARNEIRVAFTAPGARARVSGAYLGRDRQHLDTTTLIDHAADLRAPTPTGAAELAVPVRAELELALARLSARLRGCMSRHGDRKREALRAVSRALPSIDDLLAMPRRDFDEAASRLARALSASTGAKRLRFRALRLSPALLQRRLAEARTRLARDAARVSPAALSARLATHRESLRVLARRADQSVAVARERRATRLAQAWRLAETLSHRAVLRRGFALVLDADGRPVKSAATVRPGDALAIEFADGTVAAEATGGDSPRSAPRKPARKPEPGGQGSLF